MFNKLKNYMPFVIIEEESVPKILLKLIEHNPKHHLTLNIRGQQFEPCARCFGTWIGLLVGFFLSSPFWLGIFKIHNFYLVFSIAWLFALPSIFDWSTVKLGIRKGNDKVRAFVGFLHGIAVIVYFLIMPASLIFKIITYAIYGITFDSIRFLYHRRQAAKKPTGMSI